MTAHFRRVNDRAAKATVTQEGAASSPQQQQQQDEQQHELVSVTAKLLVAADGYFSRVRRQCLADGPPEVRV